MSNALIALGVLYAGGLIFWACMWSIEVSVGYHDRGRPLRMVWLSPVYPVVIVVAAIRNLPRFCRWLADCWRDAWPRKVEEPTVLLLDESRRLLTYHNMVDAAALQKLRESFEAKIARDEPMVLREDPKPGRWEQPK
ncbi:MAG TPA: hypothetical protein VGK17_03120 [Propionicimonas sp.]|jgi:hypothetical protein